MTDIVYGIRITGDARDGLKAFNETRQATERLTGAERENVRASRELGVANEAKTFALNRLRLAAIAAGAAMVAAMRSTALAAVEAERSIARLNAVWRATGGTSGLSRAQQEALAQRLAGETRFTDEEIRDAMSALSTFRQVSGETFAETLNIAASLAETFQTDLRGAIMQLGKALEDPVRGVSQLREVGVSFAPEQEKMIKNFVETGNQAKAMDMILRTLREQGLAGVAQEMNTGLSRALSDNKKAWRELAQAISGTSTVGGTTEGFLNSLSRTLTSIKNTIESGDWVEKLSLLDPTGATMAYRSLRGMAAGSQPAGGGADLAQSREAVTARWAARDVRWQSDMDRYLTAQKTILEESDKAGIAAGQAHDRMMAEAQGVLNRELANLRADLDAIDKANDVASKLHLAQLRREDEALQKAEELHQARELEAQQLRELVDPWEAYAAQIERLNKLYELGYLNAEQYGKAAALASDRALGSFSQISAAGTDTFEDMKAAVDDFGRELARSLARGEEGFRSLGDVASRFFEELLAIQLEKRLIAPALATGTSFLNDLFNTNTSGVASASQMAEFQAAGAYIGNAAAFHRGGVVGADRGDSRSVHPSVFARAPRLHGGLKPDEFPAVLQRGEGVFTPQQMRSMGSPSVKVEVINNGPPVTARQQGTPTFDGKQLVARLVLDAAATDGTFRQRLGGYLKSPQH